MIREYSVLLRLPQNGQNVLCFGHKTICCKEDMDETPEWHEVTFKIGVSGYKLKKELPEDPEETIFSFIEVNESWQITDENSDENQVIGVSKWKHLND